MQPSQPSWDTFASRLSGLLSYRMLMYLAIFFSGMVALTFQIVWQKYLSFLVGSEARSISLVVAVFLLGLAAGYQFWGQITEREMSRKTILKMVGYIELGIATYAILFSYFFEIVKALSYAAPDWLMVDLGITLILLFVPTFLMGASIPLLTAAIPNHVGEVNYCHSRVYGINTLGAFAGAFVGGFYMLPSFGLPLSLMLGAAVNIAVALVFIGNKVEGPMRKAESIPSIPHRFGVLGIYLFVFTTGAVSIAYEVLFIRILGLTLGSGHYIFPIVVGVVILGLAVGSLSLRRGSVTSRRVFAELITLSSLLVVLYFTIPHWPYWLSHVRVSLTTIPSNYGVFMLLSVIFVSLFLLPVVIPMGRLLPIGYALIDKTSSDYGKICGRVYFVNTVGTVFGAVGLGYAMFYLFDLEQLFKLNIALVMLLTAFLFIRQGTPRTGAVFIVLAAAVFALPNWNRTYHEFGIYRATTADEEHFRGLFYIPDLQDSNTVFFRDDPSMTVAVTENTHPLPSGAMITSRAIMVNGKSDGNTTGDYSNMILTGILPYLYAQKERDLDAVVIGLGTGMTSGVLAQAADVRKVTTLEISDAVMEALPYFDDFNFGLSRHEKSEIVHTDAFRFFARDRRGFDLVVSEPSNPWVVGVDNLFTREYYELASRVMNEGAIFFQWVQIYEMDNDIFTAIVNNVVHQFPYVALYVIGSADVGIVASYEPLHLKHFDRRVAEPQIERALRPMALDQGPLHMLRLFHTDQLRMVATRNRYRPHRLEDPWLGHRAGRSRFLFQHVTVGRLLQQEIGRHLPVDTQWRDAVNTWLDEEHDEWRERCHLTRRPHSADFACSIASLLREYYDHLAAPISPNLVNSKLEAYNTLRNRGLIDADIDFLRGMRDYVVNNWAAFPVDRRQQLVILLVQELCYEWEWQEASAISDGLLSVGILNENLHRTFVTQIDNIRAEAERLVEKLNLAGEMHR